MFVLETCLEETDNTTLCFASTDEQDVGLATLGLRFLHAVNEELVGRDERNAAPGEELATSDVYDDTLSQQELFKQLDAITAEDLLTTAQIVFSPERLLTLEYV